MSMVSLCAIVAFKKIQQKHELDLYHLYTLILSIVKNKILIKEKSYFIKSSIGIDISLSNHRWIKKIVSFMRAKP